LINRHKSSLDCSISLRFGTEFDHLAADTYNNVQGQGVKVQDHSVTKRVSSKNVVSQERIGWPSSNLVKMIPVRRANMWHLFKVIRSTRPEVEMWQIFDVYSEEKQLKTSYMYDRQIIALF